MTPELFQDVILTRDLPGDDLRAGDVGTLVELHDVPGRDVGYSVEFFDMTGRTVAVVTRPASDFRTPRPSDRPAVRELVGTAGGTP